MQTWAERQQLEHAYRYDDSARSTRVTFICGAALALLVCVAAVGASRTRPEDVPSRQLEARRLSVEQSSVVVARDIYRQRQLHVLGEGRFARRPARGVIATQ